MMDCVAIGFAGHHIDFDLDYETYTWQPTDPDAADLLEDSEFPLVAMKYKQRFELYSDGTFAELARTGYDV